MSRFRGHDNPTGQYEPYAPKNRHRLSTFRSRASLFSRAPTIPKDVSEKAEVEKIKKR